MKVAGSTAAFLDQMNAFDPHRAIHGLAHVSAILKALNVRSRAQAIAELSRRGVVIDGASHADTH